MRKLILKMSISIDGFVGSPDGELNFMKSKSADGAAWVLEKISQAGAHLVGRKTFSVWATYWPASTDAFAKPMNEIPKIVFSKKGFVPSRIGETPSAKSWTEAKVITGDLAEAIMELKKQAGKDLIAQGGADFAQSLVQTGLIDEYWLVTHPVAVHRGFGLFEKLSQPLYLKLIDTKVFSAGAVAHIYQPDGSL